jgi:hypothetical protein
MAGDLSRPKPFDFEEPGDHEHNGVPACRRCGGQLGFAVAGGAIEWWRCVACGQFYTAQRACRHGAIGRMRCAACGRPSVAFSVTARKLGREITVHFCSKACLTQGIEDDTERRHG